MREIPLTQGKFALVDDEDYDNLMKWKWYAHKGRHTFYAARNLSRDDDKTHTKKHTKIRMHRAILMMSNKMFIDHIDGDGLNNTRNNLRICTKSQNQYNTTLRSNNTSGFKGVSFHADTNKWQANIKKERKNIHLGLYDSPELAYVAYCKAAKELHGEFANIG